MGGAELYEMDLATDKNDTDIPTYYFKQPRGSDHIATGGSGAVYAFPDRPGEVVKASSDEPSSMANAEIEKRVYERLGASHPNIITCLRVDDLGIHLERAEHGTIREYFGNHGVATLQERIQWSRDIADALQYIHDRNIKHADLGGRNVLLDSSRAVRVCDFAGSAIDGDKATVGAEPGFELHALGSTILEIMTSLRPWEEKEAHGRMLLPTWEETEYRQWIVANRMRAGIYPDVTGVVLGDIIAKCWKAEFQSAREVVQAIDSFCHGIGLAQSGLV